MSETTRPDRRSQPGSLVCDWSGFVSMPMTAMSERAPDARVDPGGNDVGDDHAGDVKAGGHQYGAHDQRIIARHYRVIGHLAEPGPRKDDFGKYGACQQA